MEPIPAALTKGLVSGLDVVKPNCEPAIPQKIVRYTVLNPPIALNCYLSRRKPFWRE